MSIWDFLFLSFLFKDKNNKEDKDKNKKNSVILLIIGLIGYYLIFLLFIYLICKVFNISFYPIIYWIYTAIYSLFSIALVISEIINRFKRR